MEKTISAIFFALRITATIALIFIHLFFFPTNRYMYIMTGPALVSLAIYAFFFVDYFRPRIKRPTAHQIKTTAAQLVMWLIAISALLFSCFSCSARPYDGDNWTPIGSTATGDTAQYYYECQEMAIYMEVTQVTGRTIQVKYYTIDSLGNAVTQNINKY